MSALRRIMDSLAEAGRDILSRRGFGTTPADALDSDDLLALSESLISNKVEVVGIALSQRLLDGYRKLDDDQRRAYFEKLRDHFSPDPATLNGAIDAYKDDPSPENAQAVHMAAEAPRQALVRAMNTVPDAMAAVVDMRSDLLRFAREDKSLRVVDRDFQHVLTSWFNKGFLELRRIDWNSPASILEQLIRYEAVHDIQGWDDLRRRLAEDRRCYGFFHPAMPDQILIFIEVALTDEISADVRDLIESDVDATAAKTASTAIFYSINNCQHGLRGISFGNFLIKRVVGQLQEDLPKLHRFSTLSPIPGFANWLTQSEADLPNPSVSGPAADAFVRPGFDPSSAPEDQRAALLALCAHYLVEAKHKDGKPLDPVARFHLGNGARLERINWAGDPTPRGIEQSGGMLVNYLYDLDDLERNHEAFHETGAVLHSKAVKELLPSA